MEEHKSFVNFAVLVGAFIYPTIVNLTWGANFLAGTALDISSLSDLAGSTVIHSTGGWALLAAILIMGPRRGRYRDGKVRVIPASNIPLVTLGALLLWIGWFGFNGGAAAKDFSDLGRILLNTHLGAVFGILGAISMLVLSKRGFIATLIVNGALGGLVLEDLPGGFWCGGEEMIIEDD